MLYQKYVLYQHLKFWQVSVQNVAFISIFLSFILFHFSYMLSTTDILVQQYSFDVLFFKCILYSKVQKPGQSIKDSNKQLSFDAN